MYDLISGIINHEYVSNYAGDQQYIYTACIVLIVVLTVVFVDFIRDIFRSFMR